jgi:hypothetical protein
MRETVEAVSMMAQTFARHKHLRGVRSGRVDLCGNKLTLKTALARGIASD